jgi:hypothetical protein
MRERNLLSKQFFCQRLDQQDVIAALVVEKFIWIVRPHEQVWDQM